jgi:hypothetical protein
MKMATRSPKSGARKWQNMQSRPGHNCTTIISILHLGRKKLKTRGVTLVRQWEQSFQNFDIATEIGNWRDLRLWSTRTGLITPGRKVGSLVSPPWYRYLVLSYFVRCMTIKTQGRSHNLTRPTEEKGQKQACTTDHRHRRWWCSTCYARPSHHNTAHTNSLKLSSSETTLSYTWSSSSSHYYYSITPATSDFACTNSLKPSSGEKIWMGLDSVSKKVRGHT